MAPDPQPEQPVQAETAQETTQSQSQGPEQHPESIQDPPASPPLPQRHTAVTPGPRAARLQELYARSLKKTLGKIGWDNVAGCYPTVAKRAEGVLRQVQGQMVDKLGEKCEICSPHLLPPSAILAAHLTPALTAHQSQLNARLQTTQSQNALLYDEVRRQREEIRTLLDALEAVVADVQGANDALRPVVDDVAAETRQGIAVVDAANGGGQ
ncbi:kinetochore-associated NNF1 [Fusarium denticulatum]|uniref:Kinetochore-associated NNF1 n=1 Tax=Fusarium denticulatum TaxID=48507 RepID=A0A8H5U8I6_9HYPO|nr:kinetochore-associated NNF1 [Fusarium denticulatum]